MKSEVNSETKGEQGMRISAVSKITGIPTDTLRAWERRYDLVTPRRARTSSRSYSREDVQKLTLIKMLVDRGHAISNLAALSMDELNDLLALHNSESPTPRSLGRPIRIVACGDILSVKLKYEKLNDPRIDIAGIASSPATANSVFEAGNIDVLLLEYASLHKDRITEIVDLFRRSKAKHCYVIYAFSSQEIIEQLEGQGFDLCRAPVKVTALLETILTKVPVKLEAIEGQQELLDLSSTPSKLQFSTDNLVMLSSIDSALKCECPQHLADLILNLNRFEIYSIDCENRNEDDAELHRYLAQASGHARSVLETALHKVIEAEGIVLDSQQAVP